MSEEQRYIDPFPKRKDILEDPIAKLLNRYLFKLRKREVIIIKAQVRKIK